MNLIPETNPLLHTELPDYDFSNNLDLIEIKHRMTTLMRAKNGVGLAAPQVGLPHRFFIIDENNKSTMIVNPKIIDLSEETEKSVEGCLSFPNLYLPIERSKNVTILYQNEMGDFQEDRFKDFAARCIQHETDHLNGIVFTKKVSKLVLDMAERKRKKFFRE
jgi:peptide deformylase